MLVLLFTRCKIKGFRAALIDVEEAWSLLGPLFYDTCVGIVAL